MMIKQFLVFLLFFSFLNSQAQLGFGGEGKFTRADSLRGTLSEFRSCYDVLLYDLDIKIEIDTKFISGSNTIKFLAITDFQKLQLDLFENMKIEKIEFKDQNLKFTREYNAVFITFPEEIKKGSVQILKVYYSGNPLSAKNPPWDGGFSWNKDKDGNPFVGVSCQGTGASLWWPCKDHQSDEPNEMVIRVAVPSDLTEVSNGRLKNKTDLQNGYTKYEWFVSYPINNYDVTINIAKYKHFSERYYNSNYRDTLSLDYYVLPANYEKAKKQFQQVKPMLNCFYKYFGEYPFIRDGYKLVEAPYLGMEHQSCVAYGNKYKNGYLGYDRSGTGYGFDFIIIHESAHEWWGNSITTNDIADMWIHEGFGTYAEALYIECLYGYDAYLEYINSEIKGVENDKPLVGAFGVNSEGSGDMYPKGALLLHTIRSVMNNDKKFFEIIKGIQETFSYQTVNSKDIENYISEKSGIDFSEIFDLYLRATNIPKLSVKIEKYFGDIKITFRYTLGGLSAFKEGEYREKQPAFSMPVKVTFEKDTYDFIFPTTQWQTITLRDIKPEDFKIATNLFYIDKETIFINDIDTQSK
ncbi:MAG: peptidase M1 [Bacteroidetes bacterium RIFCSPLOWO2_12_FULL_35_15]|nr:MAG: peptidase M1 [Bacteroidetes bacterium RIFCSPLOWO2_12_FULL_35_15]